MKSPPGRKAKVLGRTTHVPGTGRLLDWVPPIHSFRHPAMKSTLSRLCFALSLLFGPSTLPSARAQTDGPAVDDAALDALWKEYSRVAVAPDGAAKPRVVPNQQHVDDIVTEAYRGLRETIAQLERSQREFEADYAPREHTPGELNLMPLLDEVPEPEASLPAAKQVDFKSRYETYADKIEVLRKQLADQQQRNNKYMDLQQREGQAGLMKQAVADMATPAGRAQTMEAIQLQQLLGTTLGKMQNVALQVSPAIQQCEQVHEELQRNIARWTTRVADTLPTRVMGETTVKVGYGALLKMQAVLNYAAAKQYAENRAYLWRLYKSGYKYSIGEFNDFIGEFAWGRKDSGSVFQGTYEEPMVAAAVNSVYEQMIQLTRDASTLTRMNKGAQDQYELLMQL